MSGGFFENLKICMGSQGYDSYIKTLIGYLKSYSIFLKSTCKDLYRFEDPIKWVVGWALIQDGNIELLEYTNYRFLNSSAVPKDVRTMKWLEKRGCIEHHNIFSRAVNAENYELIDYCIKKKYNQYSVYWNARNAKMYKYLWKRNVVNDTRSVWEGGGYLSMNDKMILWLKKYQHVDIFQFKLDDREQLNLLEYHACFGINAPTFKNKQVIYFIYQNIEVDLTLKICKLLPYEYAICFDSDRCECKDPKNHEEKERSTKFVKIS